MPGVLVIVGAAVGCSAALGTVLVGDLEGTTPPRATAELTQRREATGDSVTVREDVDPDATRDVELRLVARTHLADDAAAVLDRTVVR
ncbi:hypothetical protein [Haloterrigena salinisoli]|uniref:hypothetical protein n=1 Tax=Haloterrigena salinisoli TaxID=3132747 RepID=UPI0030D175D6